MRAILHLYQYSIAMTDQFGSARRDLLADFELKDLVNQMKTETVSYIFEILRNGQA